MGYSQAFNVYFNEVLSKSLLVFDEVFPTNVSYFVFFFTHSKHLFLSSREGQLTKLPETKKTLLFTFNGKRTVVCVYLGECWTLFV